jgi:hypothetical protein
MKKILFATIVFALVFASCKKSDVIDTTPPNLNVPITQTVKDIYVGGSEHTLWDPTPIIPGFNIGSYTKSQARIWKNGVQMPINATPFRGEVLDIAVLGNDVYGVGTIDTAAYNPYNQIMVKPTIWKNGVPTFLSAPGKGGGCRRIEISGNDIYVTGYEYGISSTGTGIVWKNGVVIFSEANTSINDIKVVGNDVYMVLRQGAGSGAAGSLWKNGVYTNISSTPNTAYPTGLAVVGTDVYICGFKTGGQYTQAMLWKNGVATELTNGSFEAAAYAVVVENGVVYVVGKRKGIQTTPNPTGGFFDGGVLWKNGIEDSRYVYDPSGNGGTGGIHNTIFSGIEYVSGTLYLLGYAREDLNANTGYYTSAGFTIKASATGSFPATVSNMAISNGNQYGIISSCMYITKQ